MSKILVISGHPEISKSSTNRTILSTLEASELDIQVRYLDKLYSDKEIDIEVEQELLLDADILVFQFPLYWYSTPAILKKWIDAVFTFGFAFGPMGSKLEGKYFLASTTIGSSEENYIPDSSAEKDMSVEGFLKPLNALSKYVSMKPLKPLYSFNMYYVKGIHRDEAEVVENAKNHASRLIKTLETLEL